MPLTLALAAALSIVVQADLSQTRPDLTGTWVPVDSTLSDYEVRIRQDGNSLTIETPILRVRGSTKTPMTSTRVGIHEERFALDGSEVRHGIVGPVTPQSPSRPPGEESVSRAAWSGSRIVILTHTTITAPSMTDALRQPSDPSNAGSRRQTTWRAYSLNADGQLVVERLMTVDPLPTSYARNPPVVTRVVYRRSTSALD